MVPTVAALSEQVHVCIQDRAMPHGILLLCVVLLPDGSPRKVPCAQDGNSYFNLHCWNINISSNIKDKETAGLYGVTCASQDLKLDLSELSSAGVKSQQSVRNFLVSALVRSCSMKKLATQSLYTPVGMIFLLKPCLSGCL